MKLLTLMTVSLLLCSCIKSGPMPNAEEDEQLDEICYDGVVYVRHVVDGGLSVKMNNRNGEVATKKSNGQRCKR